MSILLQAATDAVCQDSPAHRDQAANQDSQVNQELQARQATLASHRRHHVNHQLHHHASLAHKDHQDRQVPPEAPVILAKPALQDVQELTLPLEVQAREDHQDHKESQDQLDQMENQVFPLNPNHWCPESQENQETKDQTAHRDLQARQETMAPKDPQAPKASQDQTALQDRMASRDQQEPQEVLDRKERKAFVRNTVLWMAACSSRTVPDVKWPAMVSEVADSSQTSQRNAVYLLLFYVQFLFTHNDVNLKL